MTSRRRRSLQVLMCHNPRHLVSLTLNHLDAILGYVTAASVKVTLHKFVMWTSWVLFQANVELAFQHTVNNYASMHIAELQSVRLSPSYGKRSTSTSLQSEFILQKHKHGE